MTDVHDRRGVVGARSNCRYHRSVHFLGNNDDLWSKYLKMARTIRFMIFKYDSCLRWIRQRCSEYYSNSRPLRRLSRRPFQNPPYHYLKQRKCFSFVQSCAVVCINQPSRPKKMKKLFWKFVVKTPLLL